MKRFIFPIICMIGLLGCNEPETTSQAETQPAANEIKAATAPVKPATEEGLEVATLAGGCFWCIEFALERTNGVKKVISGYTGGDLVNPTYQQVGAGNTKHVEAAEIHFDPKVITYTQILDIFWRQIDPTDAGGQFVDRGYQYTTAIFYHDDEQKKIAEEIKKKLAESGKFSKPIVTRIEPAKAFYPAEEYHQDYSKKNPDHYERYSYGSGRKPFIEKMWKDEK